MKKKGFSLLEIIMAMAFMMVALVSVFWMNSASNKGSMDAYYEFMAFSLAREAIEVFRGFGYDCLNNYASGASSHPNYPVNSGAQPIKSSITDEIQRPAEAELFQREIKLKHFNSGNINAIRMTVIISIAGQSRASVWMSRDSVQLEAVIVEQPK